MINMLYLEEPDIALLADFSLAGLINSNGDA